MKEIYARTSEGRLREGLVVLFFFLLFSTVSDTPGPRLAELFNVDVTGTFIAYMNKYAMGYF